MPKVRGSQLSELIIEKFRKSARMQLAITPEGTRSRVSQWRTGFLHIAYEAQVPIVLGAIDASTRRISIVKEFEPSGDIEADMRAIKAYYKPFTGIKPEKFTTE